MQLKFVYDFFFNFSLVFLFCEISDNLTSLDIEQLFK